jgi:hypothetical protein
MPRYPDIFVLTADNNLYQNKESNMKHKIAIEPELSNVKEYLTERGYNVENLKPDKHSSWNLRNYGAIVVTGLSTNLLGINDTQTKAVVINADGLTPEEVAAQIDRRVPSSYTTNT